MVQYRYLDGGVERVTGGQRGGVVASFDVGFEGSCVDGWIFFVGFESHRRVSVAEVFQRNDGGPKRLLLCSKAQIEREPGIREQEKRRSSNSNDDDRGKEMRRTNGRFKDKPWMQR